VVVRFARHLITGRFTRQVDRHQPAFLRERLNRPVHGGDAEPAHLLLSGRQDLLRSHRAVISLKNLTDDGSLSGLSNHALSFWQRITTGAGRARHHWIPVNSLGEGRLGKKIDASTDTVSNPQMIVSDQPSGTGGSQRPSNSVILPPTKIRMAASPYFIK